MFCFKLALKISLLELKANTLLPRQNSRSELGCTVEQKLFKTNVCFRTVLPDVYLPCGSIHSADHVHSLSALLWRSVLHQAPAEANQKSFLRSIGTPSRHAMSQTVVFVCSTCIQRITRWQQEKDANQHQFDTDLEKP